PCDAEAWYLLQARSHFPHRAATLVRRLLERFQLLKADQRADFGKLPIQPRLGAIPGRILTEIANHPRTTEKVLVVRAQTAALHRRERFCCVEAEYLRVSVATSWTSIDTRPKRGRAVK